jgi:hypothetical protein
VGPQKCVITLGSSFKLNLHLQLESVYCHNPFLGYSPIHMFSLFKKRKYKKNIKNILSKNITVKKGCQSALKMVKNWLRRFKNTKIKI